MSGQASTPAMYQIISRGQRDLYNLYNFYGESLGGHGFTTVLSTIALQAPLDRARREVPSDTRTSIYYENILCRKIGEIWRSVIADIIY